MASKNAVIFITAQFGSRFVNSFLTTAVRYELLEAGGVAQFASAQVANQIARVFMQQLSGLLTDSYPLKKLYVLGEAFNIVLIVALLLSLHGNLATVLFIVNIALGLTQAFIQPVAKSLPPAVVSTEALPTVNSWDLTGDKVGRNLAPMAFTIVSSTLGFRAAALFCLVLCVILVALKQALHVVDQPTKEDSPATEVKSALDSVRVVAEQVKNGILSLKSDRTLGLLILNTIITNLMLYPLSTVVFPVIFKAIPEGAIEQEGNVFSKLILFLQETFNIQKKQAWKNHAALVSLGGVIGPFLSSLIVYQIKSFAKQRPGQVNWIGLNCGLIGQICAMLLLVFILMFLQAFSAGASIFLLFLAWGALNALGNITTIYFNAHTQRHLGRKERGKFVANILTLFTLANTIGSSLYGWALSAEGLEQQLSTVIHLLLAAFVVRLCILMVLRMDSAGKQKIFVKEVSA